MEMLRTIVFGDVKNDYAVGVDINLLVAYDQLFDPLLAISLDELLGITQLQFRVPFNHIIVLGGINLIDLKQIQTQSGSQLIGQ